MNVEKPQLTIKHSFFGQPIGHIISRLDNVPKFRLQRRTEVFDSTKAQFGKSIFWVYLT